MKTLSRDEARRVYDRIGKLQDSQAFYEEAAVDLLIEHGAFDRARRVFEFGCGTGRIAHRLLSERLPSDARYHAIDLSPKMVELAKARLAAFGARVAVDLSDGSPELSQSSASFDRFVSTYVLDLMSEDDIHTILGEAHRILEPAGLLCLSSLSTGSGTASRCVARVWSGVHRLSPGLVGGCRPLELAGHLSPSDWRILKHARVAPFGVPSEVVVAERV
jgi:ubiquinone/menaquinone biosynthesis C-methylase UbiE